MTDLPTHADIHEEGPREGFQIEPGPISTRYYLSNPGISVVKGQKLTIKQAFNQRPPSDTAASCNLAKNPNENKQFEVTI